MNANCMCWDDSISLFNRRGYTSFEIYVLKAERPKDHKAGNGIAYYIRSMKNQVVISFELNTCFDHQWIL